MTNPHAAKIDAQHDRDLAAVERIAAERRGQRRYLHPAPAAERTVPEPLRTVDIAELLTLDIPAREVFLAPWLTAQSLSMIWAWRGTGKTLAALAVAYAVASGGSAFGWQAPKPRRVLYLDGELPCSELQARAAALVAVEDQQPAPGMLRFLTPDLQPRGMPNLATAAGQLALQPLVADADLIVVDSIATLGRGGRENEAEGWQPVAAWALDQRAAGRAVLFVHHAGKGGQQRGTSSREDILDVVLSLKRPSDYHEREGARFEVRFEKARALKGADVEPFEARLETGPDDRRIWTCKPADIGRNDRILELGGLGMSVREIAEELGVSKSSVHRALQHQQEAAHE